MAELQNKNEGEAKVEMMTKRKEVEEERRDACGEIGEKGKKKESGGERKRSSKENDRTRTRAG